MMQNSLEECLTLTPYANEGSTGKHTDQAICIRVHFFLGIVNTSCSSSWRCVAEQSFAQVSSRTATLPSHHHFPICFQELLRDTKALHSATAQRTQERARSPDILLFNQQVVEPNPRRLLLDTSFSTSNNCYKVTVPQSVDVFEQMVRAHLS